MTVVTRFAPSPTGFLHIGGARTALFNWLFARHNGGKFLLRIEDTDLKRSTEEAKQAILDGLQWLGLDWDGETVFQSQRADLHAAAAQRLLEAGQAYHCYCSPEELTEMREAARANGKPMRYDGRWRDRSPKDAPDGVAPVVRFKAPQTGETVIDDQVQGQVTVANDQLDDMVLLRANGTPTYMLSVVVDDHDMGVTHAIRGDDHLTNAFRQSQLYQALGWETPIFAHIPLIHGADGAKMSKRHGALGVEAYRDMGLLPEALRNYLLRLGWGHGDDEIISTKQAIEWFDLTNVGKSAARFDIAKLTNLNGHYMRSADDSALVQSVLPFITERLGAAPDEKALSYLTMGMPGLKERAKTLLELADLSLFYCLKRPISKSEKAGRLLNPEIRNVLDQCHDALSDIENWNEEAVESVVKYCAEQNELKLGKLAQPLRAALTGTAISPGIFEVMVVLGKSETLGRLQDALTEIEL